MNLVLKKFIFLSKDNIDIAIIKIAVAQLFKIATKCKIWCYKTPA